MPETLVEGDGDLKQTIIRSAGGYLNLDGGLTQLGPKKMDGYFTTRP